MFRFGKILKVIILLLFLIIINSCSDNDDNSNPLAEVEFERGRITSSNQIASLTTTEVQQIVNLLIPTSPFTLKYGVNVYSVNYYTVDGSNREQLASGAVIMPKQAESVPVISLQHGTETKADAVASVNYINSVEGVAGVVFASIGYIVFVPDYLGFGASNIDHPYMHAQSLTPGIIDFIRAGNSLSKEKGVTPNNNTFLTGYSEGGYLTLAAQKDIEQNYTNEIFLTAVAPMAGPYDFRATVDTILAQGEYSTPYYIAYVLKSYNEIYNWNKLDDFFQTPYNTTVSSLFNGAYNYETVTSQLPQSLNKLLKNDFVNSYLNGNENDLQNAIDDNSLLGWTPVAPIHFFHGDSDEVVYYSNALKAVEEFSSRGANVKLTTIYGGTHASAGIEAMIGSIEWINTFD